MSSESKVVLSAENETKTEIGSYTNPEQYITEIAHQYMIAAVT